MSTATTYIETEKRSAERSRSKLIPALRFKEFDECISKTKLGEISTIRTGPFGSMLHQEDYVEEGTPIITVEHLSEQGIVHKNLPLVSDSDKLRLKSYTLAVDDIVFSRVGSVDRNSIISEKENDWLFSGRLLRIRTDKEIIESSYLGYYFQLEFTKHRIRSVAVGQTMPSLNTQILKSFYIEFPDSIPEQQKIASFLSAVDKKIQQLTKKKALLEQYKKGIMQQLFSGQLRFKDENGNPYPDWEEKLLGKLIEICSSKRVLQEEWKEEGVPFLRTREIINLSNNVGFRTPIFITDELFEELKLKYGVPKSGDILATGVGTIGQLYIVNQSDKFYFKDGNVIWFKMNMSLDSDYLNQLFKTRFIRKQLNNNASITTVATFTIDGARKTKIIYPCIEEQQKIAIHLSSIDTKIVRVNNQIIQTQTFKKGLLQQMFV